MNFLSPIKFWPLLFWAHCWNQWYELGIVSTPREAPLEYRSRNARDPARLCAPHSESFSWVLPGLANELLPRVGFERPSPGEGLAERRHFGSRREHIHILI